MEHNANETNNDTKPQIERTLQTERYEDQLEIWPKKGQHVLAQYDDDTIVVYQAFKPSIAQWAVANQKFGGPDYNTTRMTWVKTNFLWMMYRSKWGTKHDQQSTLAVWIKRSAFEQLMSRAVVNKSHEEMKAGEKYKKPKGARGTVRLQWDPDHRPDGSETVRRAIQIGLKGIEDFTNGDLIVKIEDISEFVAQQYALVTKGDLKSLVVPRERVYNFTDKEIARHINPPPILGVNGPTPVRLSNPKNFISLSTRGKDLANFGLDDDFDVKDWINEALKNCTTEDAIENQAGDLRVKLQLLSSELSASLDELSVKCVSRIPKAMREIELIKKDAVHLKQRVAEIQTKLSTMETQTQKSIDVLAELDEIKSRMEVCNQIIQESSKFTSYIGSIERAFDKKEENEISKVIEDMERSAAVLKDIPEYQNSQEKLNFYKQRLEGMLKPRLLQALKQSNREETKKYLQIYKRINMYDEFLQSYYKCKLVSLSEYWNSFDLKKAAVPGEVKQEQKPEALLDNLSSFYDEVLLVLNSELEWTQTIFDDPYSILVVLIVELHNEIRKSFEERLKKLRDLPLLISCYAVSRGFASSVENFLKTEDLLKVHASKSIIQPYFGFQLAYPKAEKEYLLHQLNQIKPTLEGFGISIQNVSSAVPKITTVLQGSIERLIQFTEGSEAIGYCNMLNEVIIEYLKAFFHVLQHLRSLAHLADLDYSRPVEQKKDANTQSFHSWQESYFQGALQLVEVISKFSDKLQSFMKNLQSSLRHQRVYIYGEEIDPANVNVRDLTVMHLREESEKAVRLLSFLNHLNNESTNVLSKAFEQVSSLQIAAKQFVFDTMFVYIRDKLLTVPSLEGWRIELPDAQTMPQFSLSAQGYIKLIVEHFLSVSQFLEPYGTSNVFALPANFEGMKYPIIQAYINDQTKRNDKEQDLDSDDEVGGNALGSEENYSLLWISLLSKATMNLYVNQIFSIPKLTIAGGHQLSVDIAHLFNILAVLGMEADEALITIQNLCKQPKELIEEELQKVSPQQVIVQEVAKIRGIVPNNSAGSVVNASESNPAQNNTDGNNLNTGAQTTQTASTATAPLQRTNSNK